MKTVKEYKDKMILCIIHFLFCFFFLKEEEYQNAESYIYLYRICFSFPIFFFFFGYRRSAENAGPCWTTPDRLCACETVNERAVDTARQRLHYIVKRNVRESM